MSSALLLNNSDSTTLAIPKLHNDGVQRAMGSKGLWRHVEGTTIVHKLYALVTRVPVLSDSTTPAMEDQIEAKETKIMDYNKHKYLAQHVILSTTSTHLSAKIKNMKLAHKMWDVLKVDATTKSTLYLLDAKDQLASMKLTDNDGPKNSPCWSQAALPAYDRAPWQPHKDGLCHIWHLLQHHHHVIPPRFLLPNIADHYGCRACK